MEATEERATTSLPPADDFSRRHIGSGAHLVIDSLAELNDRVRQWDLDDENRLRKYTEKPSFPYLVSMGVNVFDRGVLKLIRIGSRANMYG